MTTSHVLNMSEVGPGVWSEENPTDIGALLDMLAILRTLAQTDVDQLRWDMGDAARKVTRDVQRVNATPGLGELWWHGGVSNGEDGGRMRG